jgi:hypothetical protein
MSLPCLAGCVTEAKIDYFSVGMSKTEHPNFSGLQKNTAVKAVPPQLRSHNVPTFPH